MATKFENRTTVAVAVVMNFEAMNFEVHEVEIPYTRTIAKAIDMVAAKLSVPANTVTIKELKQTEFKAQNLTSGQLVNISTEYGLDEPAKEVPVGFACVPYTAYQYFGTAFGYKKEDNAPLAIPLVVEQLEKHGKNDARGMLIHQAEDIYEMTVFALDYKQRHEVKRYAVVDSTEYQKMRYQG